MNKDEDYSLTRHQEDPDELPDLEWPWEGSMTSFLFDSNNDVMPVGHTNLIEFYRDLQIVSEKIRFRMFVF